jgi:P-type conjugative transfer protein TrbJ
MRKLILFGVIYFALAIPMPVRAEVVYCTNCSNQFMQALDRVTNVEQLASLWKQYEEDVVQTAQQIRMVQQNIEQYQNMIQNTDSLNENTLRRMSGDFKRLASYLNKLKTQKGDTEALEQVYTMTFPDYADIEGIVTRTPEEYQRGWKEWSKTVDRAALATFQISGGQLGDLANSDELDAHIQELLSTPEGRMQALQAGNQLSAIQIREARELRALLATQIQSQVLASQKAEKKEQAGQAFAKEFLKSGPLEGVSWETAKPTPDNSF